MPMEIIENKSLNENQKKSIHESGGDVRLAQKFEALSTILGQTQTRLHALEMAGRRPDVAGVSAYAMSPAVADHQQAFVHYVRKGLDGDLQTLEQKALSVQSDPDGGYLVPETFGQTLVQSIAHTTPIRSFARVMTISTDAVDLLVDREDADAGWVSETGERRETKTPELTKLRIAVHELYAKPRATQKLLDDARIDVEAWLIQKITEKMTAIENEAFLFGDGMHCPRGILSHPMSVGRSGGQGHIELFTSGEEGKLMSPDVLFDMLYAMRPEHLDGARWFLSRAALDQVRRLRDPQSGQYLWQPQLSLGQPSSLLGYPVVLMDQLPAPLEAQKRPNLLFANLQEGYQIVDRAGTRVLRDPYSAKPYVEFYTTRRVGGDVINPDAIKALAFIH